MVVAINLEQFPNHKTCNRVKNFVSLSGSFFIKKEVIGDCLFLEQATSKMNESLMMLNEESDMDFRFGRVPGKSTIEELIGYEI